MLQNLTQFLSQAREELENTQTTVTSHSNHARLWSYHKATFSTPTISMGKNPHQYLRERADRWRMYWQAQHTHNTHSSSYNIVHTVYCAYIAITEISRHVSLIFDHSKSVLALQLVLRRLHTNVSCSVNSTSSTFITLPVVWENCNVW